MENASKALIIAGAILLSILIIALGIYVFNMAKNASDTSSLDELEVSQFNQVFTNYRGKKLGSVVVDLLDKVVSNAVTNAESDERLPDVIYLETRTTGGLYQTNMTNSLTLTANQTDAANSEGFTAGNLGFYIQSDSSNTNVDLIGSMRSKMASKHYYQVGFHMDNTSGLIDYIIIQY